MLYLWKLENTWFLFENVTIIKMYIEYSRDIMETKKYVYWEDKGLWIGYLEEYPDYMTQGESLEELKENLKDIYNDLTSGYIHSVRRVAELEVSWKEKT